MSCWSSVAGRESFVIVVVLGDVCETAGAHCLKEEVREKVEERDGRSNSLVLIRPSLPFSLQPPRFWFGESFIPPIMLCIGAGWGGGCMVSQVVVVCMLS